MASALTAKGFKPLYLIRERFGQSQVVGRLSGARREVVWTGVHERRSRMYVAPSVRQCRMHVALSERRSQKRRKAA